MATVPEVRGLYHEPTSTFSYVVWDPATRQAAVIDPVLDYDGAAGRTGTASAAALLTIIESERLELRWILETHAHADHLSAAAFLHERTGAPVAIGRGITSVQANFRDIYNLGAGFPVDGRQFDRLFADGERFMLGEVEIEVMATPGHTDDSVTYRAGDAAFIGDTLFAPDYGTARCDFPGGDAARLFASVQRLYALPPETRLFLCHDYPPEGRAPRCEWSVAEQRAGNIHIDAATREADFVRMRTARDAGLKMPALIIPAVQVNIRAGRLPEPEDNGRRYLRVPLDTL
ncbi:MBL fold metallo-hydrolase [Thioalkalivibrio sp. XN279]|uniref:MBL fold metallo-hydrolase n=1 Tax=Thioalkalivibrio sp. XN279 TaxID=2714953 RepID=UPI00140D604F|nr:MBL fold metallo-hydrolase [Thioalkalivibrio sp. XN279]NHA14939.1 MBL fold metallo-hydrolase [Thioalkalivibrio sp. XN279]